MRNIAVDVAFVLLIIAGAVFFPTQLSKNARSPAENQSQVTPETKSVVQNKKPDDLAKPNNRVKPVNKTWTASSFFSGNETGQTDIFTVPKGPWRLRWEVDGYPSAASVGFSVISTEDSAKTVFEEHGLSAPRKGVVRIPRGGEFYILVSSYEANWKLTVENH